MNIEIPVLGTPKEAHADLDRGKIVEEVFKGYHKELIGWCVYKLTRRYPRSFNPKSDAEEIVAYVYQRLLIAKTPIDLTRPESDIRGFLNSVLDNAINTFASNAKRKKRIPLDKLVSLEEKAEEELSSKLEEYFADPDNEKRGMHADVAQALLELQKKDKKLADIIRKRYQLGMTLEEIGKEKEYNCTKDQIRKKEARAIRMIRYFIEYGKMD